MAEAPSCISEDRILYMAWENELWGQGKILITESIILVNNGKALHSDALRPQNPRSVKGLSRLKSTFIYLISA